LELRLALKFTLHTQYTNTHLVLYKVPPSIDDTRVKHARLRLAFRESYTRMLDKRLRQQVRWRHSSAHRRAALQRMRVTYAGPKRVETFRLTATSSRWRQTSRRQVQVQVQVQVLVPTCGELLRLPPDSSTQVLRE